MTRHVTTGAVIVVRVTRIDDLARALRLRGHVEQYLPDDAGAQAWRKDARAAGRKLERPVRTYRLGGDVGAVLQDWPRNELEQHADDLRMRRIVNMIAVSDPEE